MIYAKFLHFSLKWCKLKLFVKQFITVYYLFIEITNSIL